MTAVAAILLTGGLDHETLECEQAIAHLQSCCGKLHAPNACGDGCSSITLSLDESACIQEADCDTLRSRDICRRVEQLSDSEADAGAEHEEICP